MTCNFTIDVAKMKRWHGAPPLLHGQDESDFDEFIASLATCVRSGDALAESLVYRYGIERWRMGQLLFQREKLSLAHHCLIVEFNRRDEERRKHREDQKTEGADRADAVKAVGTNDIVFMTVIGADVIPEIRRNMHYSEKHQLDEMTVAREFEFMIAQYQKLERSINECDAQASNLLLQMAIHRVTITEKEEQESFREYLGAIGDLLEAQELEREAKRAAETAPPEGQ